MPDRTGETLPGSQIGVPQLCIRDEAHAARDFLDAGIRGSPGKALPP